MTNTKALERTLAADPVYSAPEHAGVIALTRELAAELDAQVESSGAGQTRTIATYAGLLGQLRRILRDDRMAKAKGARRSAPASRIAAIKQNIASTKESA